jgi:voltage-gated sodium channel
MSQSRDINTRLAGEDFVLPEYRILWLARILYSAQFETFIAVVIVFNAVSLAYLTFPSTSAEATNVALQIDQIAFIIYCFELVIRLISYGKKPWKFFTNGWNIFDFLVIALVPILQGQTAVLRLLRLLRLLRIFRFLPEVRLLTTSIVKSIPPLLSMTALIFLLLFVYGMAGTYLFGAAAPQSWGDIGSSLKSLLILLTLENFPNYFEEALAISPLALLFFISYVFIIVFTVLNVLIGIVLHAMDQARDEIASENNDVMELRTLVSQIEDALQDGELSQKEAKEISRALQRAQQKLSEPQNT